MREKMSQYHYSATAYLWCTDRAVEVLSRALSETRTFFDICNSTRHTDGIAVPSPLLCVDLGSRADYIKRRSYSEIWAPSQKIDAEIASHGRAEPWESFMEQRRWPAPYSLDADDCEPDEAELASGRRKVRFLAWLARETEARVSYYLHAGDNGPIHDLFLGFGDVPAMFYNEHLTTGPSQWAARPPQGAGTAALWYLRSRAILTPRFDVFMVRWGVAAG
jgi:hypothetical protein